MPIIGLTDEAEDINPVYEMLGVADVKCYKGARKTGTGDSTRPGSDLKEKIRIATSHKGAISILKDAYDLSNEPNSKGDFVDTNGDFIVSQINLYLALENPDLTFETQMKAFDGSGTLTLCDRDTIYKEAQNFTTHKGTRRTLKSCNKPCPLRGQDSWDCPNECKPNGMLHFFIRELLDSDLMIHCQFEMKAYGDVGNIIKQIRRIQRELGSLTRSPYPCYWTRHKIPLVLSRVMRSRKRPDMALKPEDKWKRQGKKEYEFTGKKADAKFWDLDLQVDPIWMDWYRKQQLAEELISRGINPAKEVIVGLMTGDTAIDVKAIASSTTQVQALPPSIAETPVIEPEPKSFIPTPPNERLVTLAMLRQLYDAFDVSGWTEDAITQLLEHYQISDLEQINKEQWLELTLIVGNREAARQWNDKANTPQVEVVVETITKADWSDVIYPVFAQNRWTNQAIMDMLQNEYGINRVGQLMKSQVDELIEVARSVSARSRWIPND